MHYFQDFQVAQLALEGAEDRINAINTQLASISAELAQAELGSAHQLALTQLAVSLRGELATVEAKQAELITHTKTELERATELAELARIEAEAELARAEAAEAELDDLINTINGLSDDLAASLELAASRIPALAANLPRWRLNGDWGVILPSISGNGKLHSLPWVNASVGAATLTTRGKAREGRS